MELSGYKKETSRERERERDFSFFLTRFDLFREGNRKEGEREKGESNLK